MPRAVEGVWQFVETFVDDQSAFGDPADDDTATFDIQSEESDVKTGFVLDRQNSSALFRSERELDSLFQSALRVHSIDSEARVLDGAIDAVESGARQTFVAVVQVVAVTASRALVNGTKFQF